MNYYNLNRTILTVTRELFQGHKNPQTNSLLHMKWRLLA
jgi:hypothetical protein